jgi:prepilin-type N-terminal cleavage/methylation domain-containing protein
MDISKPGRLGNCAGFTLTEVLVVIALIVTLSGFGYSGFSGWQKKERIRSVAYDFAAQLREARMRAIEKHKSQTFLFTANEYKVFGDTNGDCELSDDESVIRQVKVDQEDRGIAMTTSPADLALRFDRKGMPIRKGGGFGICSVHFANEDGYHVDIDVSSLGRINVAESN